MAYTKYAQFIRALRIKNHETILDTANLFNVSVPFVSAVENGKKNVPENWINILTEHYQLDKLQQNELLSAIENSKIQAKINLCNAPDYRRELAIMFQRSFDEIEEETAKKIYDLLQKEDK